MELADRFVLLTGGSRGIGPPIAEALARRGGHLALVARSEEPLQRVCASLRSLGVQAVGFGADLGEPAERERLVERVLSEFGRIDVLVNNAGLESEGAFVDLPWEPIQRMIEVNLLAPVHLTHLVLPRMLARSEGHVVHIASLAGKAGLPFDAVYSGTKSGLAGWSEGLRREIAGTGVGISTVFPGYVTDAGMFARFHLKPPWLVGSCTPEQVAAAVLDSITRGRPEVIVNSRPLRPAMALAEMFPPLGDWLLHRLGVFDLQRRKASAASVPEPGRSPAFADEAAVPGPPDR